MSKDACLLLCTLTHCCLCGKLITRVIRTQHQHHLTNESFQKGSLRGCSVEETFFIHKHHYKNRSAMRVKKQDTELLSITLPYISEFSQFSHYYTQQSAGNLQ